MFDTYTWSQFFSTNFLQCVRIKMRIIAAGFDISLQKKKKNGRIIMFDKSRSKFFQIDLSILKNRVNIF